MKYLVDNNNRFQSKRNLKHLNLGLLICGFKCTLYSHLRYNNKERDNTESHTPYLVNK